MQRVADCTFDALCAAAVVVGMVVLAPLIGIVFLSRWLLSVPKVPLSSLSPDEMTAAEYRIKHKRWPGKADA